MIRSVMASAPGIGTVFRNGLGAAGANGFEMVLRAAYFILLTRALGPELYGIWSYALSVCGVLLALISGGLETVVTAHSPTRDGEDDALLKKAVRIRVALSALAALGMAGWALGLGGSATEQVVLTIAATALVGRGLALLLRSPFVARQQVDRSIAPILIARSAEVLTGIALLTVGAPLPLLVALHSLCWFVEALLLGRRLQFGSRKTTAQPPAPATGDLLRRGLPIAILDLCSMILVSAPVVLFQPFAASFADIGQLAVATQLGAIALALAFAFLTSALPALSRTPLSDRRRRWTYAFGIAAAAALAIVLVQLLYDPVARPVLAAIFGERYDLAANITYYALMAACFAIMPHGFLQVLLVDRTLGPIVLASVAISLALAVWFVLTGASMVAVEAQIAALVAWMVRAAAIMVLGAIGIARAGRA